MLDIDLSKLAGLLTYDPDAPMLFNSGLFVWLFLGFSLVYALLHKRDVLRIAFVTLFSYYFYYKSSGACFFLLAVVTVSDYLLARMMHRTSSRRGRLACVTLSIVINLGLLCYFKYTNFFYATFMQVVGGTFSPLDIVLPVGISFFTFQSMSYTIDIYRGKLSPLGSLLDYAFYVSFFPMLVAGPIVRASDFIPQIHRRPTVDRDMFARGIFLIVCGLLKKAVISDYISVNFVSRVFDNPSLYSGVENLFAIYGYALQIYCDFSGYSDMAIGLALLLGFKVPANFDSPYKSQSVSEFWHRWHISLSTWLRDYLYISLGGNRRGKVRTYINLMLTMLLGGLWHGASWNFIFWGGFHGLCLVVDKFVRSLRLPSPGRGGTMMRVVKVVVTFHLVCFGWIFFRNTDFNGSVAMLRQIFSDFHPELFWQLVTGYAAVFALMAVGFVTHFVPDGWSQRVQSLIAKSPVIISVLLLALAIFVVIQVKSMDVQPFIYFQF